MLNTLRYLTALMFLGLCLNIQASTEPLPETVLAALKRARIPVSGVSIVVQQADAKAPLVAVNAEIPVNPASTMKLLTTFAGLEMLGPAYQWKTEAYLDGKLENGVLEGDLIFKGYGDPKLTMEQFWMWLRELRQHGLREIHGDIVLDHSYFADIPHDPAEFDNDPTRAYNVGPDALMLNFNALHLRLVPGKPGASAVLEPDLSGYEIRNRIRTAAKQPCRGGDTYSARLEERYIVLEGTIPGDCGEVNDYISLLPHDEYFFAVFSSLWQELGGTLTGKLREGTVPAEREAFSTRLSQPLSEVIRDINKFSNNTMARQLFLTLGASDGYPASIAGSTTAVNQWLDTQHMQFPELVLENGAGLSRVERISVQHMGELLQCAARSPFAAELESSLPVLGMDGTMKKRFKGDPIAGYAHIKTGMLEDVKSIAGYVHASDGSKWVVVFIINHPNAKYGQAAQDALIEWVQKQRS